MQTRMGSFSQPSAFEEDAFQSDDAYAGSATSHVETRQPHPVYAPLAWLACLLFGAGFWAAILYYIFS